MGTGPCRGKYVEQGNRGRTEGSVRGPGEEERPLVPHPAWPPLGCFSGTKPFWDPEGGFVGRVSPRQLRGSSVRSSCFQGTGPRTFSSLGEMQGWPCLSFLLCSPSGQSSSEPLTRSLSFSRWSRLSRKVLDLSKSRAGGGCGGREANGKEYGKSSHSSQSS